MTLSDFYYVCRKLGKNLNTSAHRSFDQKRHRALIQLPQKLVSAGAPIKIGQDMLANHMTRGGNLVATIHSNGRIE